MTNKETARVPHLALASVDVEYFRRYVPIVRSFQRWRRGSARAGKDNACPLRFGSDGATVYERAMSIGVSFPSVRPLGRCFQV